MMKDMQLGVLTRSCYIGTSFSLLDSYCLKLLLKLLQLSKLQPHIYIYQCECECMLRYCGFIVVKSELYSVSGCIEGLSPLKGDIFITPDIISTEQSDVTRTCTCI